jgi:hypothetical protein
MNLSAEYDQIVPYNDNRNPYSIPDDSIRFTCIVKNRISSEIMKGFSLVYYIARPVFAVSPVNLSRVKRRCEIAVGSLFVKYMDGCISFISDTVPSFSEL